MRYNARPTSNAGILAALLSADGPGSLLDADYLDGLSSAAFALSGANTDITSLTGTVTNDAAAAGKIGEVLSSIVLAGSAVALTTNTPANMTSLALTAGDWDVTMVLYYAPGASTSITRLIGSPSATSATLDTTTGKYADLNIAANVPGNAGYISQVVPSYRLSLASTTTIYAVAMGTFTVSTLGVFGLLRARRMR